MQEVLSPRLIICYGQIPNDILTHIVYPISAIPIMRSGKVAINGKGVLRIKARKRILKELKRLEVQVGELISQEELYYIQDCWTKDAKMFKKYRPPRL
jgi:hypothetical protein